MDSGSSGGERSSPGKTLKMIFDAKCRREKRGPQGGKSDSYIKRKGKKA